MSAAKRRTCLPRSLGGRKFKYDRITVVQPLEISPKSPHWNEVPESQRYTRNYFLKYLPSGVRGRCVFSHDRLVELLRGKREKA